MPRRWPSWRPTVHPSGSRAGAHPPWRGARLRSRVAIPCAWSCSGSFRGLLDRGADARVSPAATDIARHRPVDVGIARMGVLREQRRCRHNLTRLAVAALHDLEGQPRLLHLLAGRRLPDRLYGGNSLAGDCTHRRDARADRLSVEVHRACPAERHAATELRAGETDHITQHPEERHVRGHVHGVVLTVDAEGDHARVLSSRLYVHCSRDDLRRHATECGGYGSVDQRDIARWYQFCCWCSRGSSAAFKYSRPRGPMAVTWVTYSPDFAQWKWDVLPGRTMTLPGGYASTLSPSK